MTVAEMRARMGHREYLEWAEFYKDEIKERERQAKQQQNVAKARARRGR